MTDIHLNCIFLTPVHWLMIHLKIIFKIRRKTIAQKCDHVTLPAQSLCQTALILSADLHPITQTDKQTQLRHMVHVYISMDNRTNRSRLSFDIQYTCTYHHTIGQKETALTPSAHAQPIRQTDLDTPQHTVQMYIQ